LNVNDDTRLTITLGGDGGTSWQVAGWKHITLAQASAVLSMVTGYSSEALAEQLSEGLVRSKLGVWSCSPAGPACPVRFLVSVDDAGTQP
jgi:hypothetical protein